MVSLPISAHRIREIESLLDASPKLRSLSMERRWRSRTETSRAEAACGLSQRAEPTPLVSHAYCSQGPVPHP